MRTGRAPALPAFSMRYVFRLPFPPSTNNLFRSAGRRRVKTAAATAFRTQARLAMRSFRPARFERPIVAVMIRLHPPADGRRRDASNYVKAIEDAATGRMYADDSQLRQSFAEMCEPDPNGPGAVVVFSDSPFTVTGVD